MDSNCSFIEVYDDALTEEECSLLIDQFEKDPRQADGVMNVDGHEIVDAAIKKCKQLSLKLDDNSIISKISGPALRSCVKEYHQKYDVLENTNTWRIDPGYNVQKYETPEEGYNRWHCEYSPAPKVNLRIGAWMFYLNDAESGTDFKNFPTIDAKIGRCVIWPAFWTHMHRSHPNKGLKYILTGWLSHDFKPVGFLTR